MLFCCIIASHCQATLCYNMGNFILWSSCESFHLVWVNSLWGTQLPSLSLLLLYNCSPHTSSLTSPHLMGVERERERLCIKNIWPCYLPPRKTVWMTGRTLMQSASHKVRVVHNTDLHFCCLFLSLKLASVCPLALCQNLQRYLLKAMSAVRIHKAIPPFRVVY